MPLSGWSHDIRDPAAFVGEVIRRAGGELDHGQRERLHQFLLITLWELSLDYRANGQPSNFSGHAGRILPQRVTDWRRSNEEGGRTKWVFAERVYVRDLPTFVEFDDEFLGTADVDQEERMAAERERLDAERTIGAASYLPPRSYFPDRRTRRTPDRQTTSKTAVRQPWPKGRKVKDLPTLDELERKVA
jgi:hypothetical protein